MGIAHRANRLTRCGIGGGPTDDDAIYRTWHRRFLTIFGVITASLLVAGLLTSSLSVNQRLAFTGTIVFLGGWYQIAGQWNRITTDLHAVVYLLGNLIAICIAISIWNTASILLFGIYWLGFAYLYIVPATVYALVLTIATQFAFGNGSLFTEFSSGTLVGVVLLLVITGFSGMMAKYIESFQKESERNKHLLVQLQRAQASLAEREREAGIEQERRRMAGEIHDTIAQEFTSIITNLRAAMQQSDELASNRHLELSLAAATQGLADSRAMLATMQPDVLQGRSLIDALRAIVDDEQKQLAPAITFAPAGVPTPLNRSVETILVRSLQESLRNVRKHAVATQVTVTLSWLEDEVLLDITDDGIGYDTEVILPSTDGFQMGLATMRARVESAGGTFVLESSPGEGTSITVSFPTGEES